MKGCGIVAKEYLTREVIAILKFNGFCFQRSKGGHSIFSDGKHTVSIPIHGKTVNKMLFNRLIKENKLILGGK